MPSRISFIKKIYLPKLTVPGNILLAPIAGYTDAAFRSICIGFGAFLCFTEMLSAEALARNNPKTLKLLKRADNENLLGVQIFASNPDSAVRAVQAILPFNPGLLDLNCGCSVPKILKAGCGAALLREPHRIRDIIRAMRAESSVPVSVKLRSGWDLQSINYLKTADMALKGGSSLINLHPRTRAQGFKGRANINHIKALKKNIDLPIIGSGDLFSAEDALNMVRETECDGVMLARGAIGNPFIFTQTYALFSGSHAYQVPSSEEKLLTALRQLSLAIKYKGEYHACKEFRKHFCAYTKGMVGASVIRKQIIKAGKQKDYEQLAADFLNSSHRIHAN